jgi:hypothetical protein
MTFSIDFPPHILYFNLVGQEADETLPKLVLLHFH